MQATTTKTISTISYNTRAFLDQKLNELKKADIIVYGFYIYHEPEQDEAKGHFHVVMEPNGKVNLRALQKEFLEIDLSGNPKPLGVLPFNITQSYDDWLLYAIHDPDYLLSKGLAREYHYQFTEIHTTTDDEIILQDKINAINHLNYSRDHEIYEAVKNGSTDLELVEMGLIPMRHLGYYQQAIIAIRQKFIFRRTPSHTPKESTIKDEYGRELLVGKNGDILGVEVGGDNPFTEKIKL